MKICYIADTASIHTRKWVKFFAERNHETHLISYKFWADAKVDNVSLYVLRAICPQMAKLSFAPNLVSNLIQLRGLLKRIKPDILHAHYVTDSGLLAALSGFHPFVMTAWGSDVLVLPQEFRRWRWIVKYVVKRADLLTCDAEHMKKKLIELGAYHQKIRIVNFGVDVAEFDPDINGEKIREKLGLASSPVVISLRSLEPVYDIESLISSISLVSKKIPEAKFIIAGRGSQEFMLKELSKSLGILENTKFVGLIPYEELPQYLRAAEIYVSTSLSDAGLAASTAEAMACKLPVVITDFGDNRDWVKDGEGGFIIPTKNPAILAEKIVYLLQNQDVRRRFGKINRRVIEERNNYQKEMAKMESLYNQMIDKYKSNKF